MEPCAAIGRFFAERMPGAAVYVYGSFARNAQRADSDIDVAVLAPAMIARSRIQDLREALAVLLRRDVDLVDLRGVSTVLQKEVVSGGVVLLDPDHSMRASFEAFVYGRYARLNEERRPILERVRREGTILGLGIASTEKRR